MDFSMTGELGTCRSEMVSLAVKVVSYRCWNSRRHVKPISAWVLVLFVIIAMGSLSFAFFMCVWVCSIDPLGAAAAAATDTRVCKTSSFLRAPTVELCLLPGGSAFPFAFRSVVRNIFLFRNTEGKHQTFRRFIPSKYADSSRVSYVYELGNIMVCRSEK